MSKKSAKQKVSDYLDTHGVATAQKIANDLKLDVGIVHRRVYDLREEGHDITSESYKWAGRERVRYVY